MRVRVQSLSEDGASAVWGRFHEMARAVTRTDGPGWGSVAPPALFGRNMSANGAVHRGRPVPSPGGAIACPARGKAPKVRKPRVMAATRCAREGCADGGYAVWGRFHEMARAVTRTDGPGWGSVAPPALFGRNMSANGAVHRGRPVPSPGGAIACPARGKAPKVRKPRVMAATRCARVSVPNGGCTR